MPKKAIKAKIIAISRNVGWFEVMLYIAITPIPVVINKSRVITRSAILGPIKKRMNNKTIENESMGNKK